MTRTEVQVVHLADAEYSLGATQATCWSTGPQLFACWVSGPGMRATARGERHGETVSATFE